MAQLLVYPFPLRPGLLCNLELPADLVAHESRRLQAFLATLETSFPQPPVIGPPGAPARTTERAGAP